MRNLWIFLSRYNAFFLFLIFFSIGIYLTLTNNNYQKSITLNSTNQVVGTAYKRLNVFKRYLSLGSVNDSLALENAKLKTELAGFINPDTLKNITFKDTLNNKQYSFIAARVIKNSITLRNNYITINKGSLQGIEKGMAVMSANLGVVGFIDDVSPNLARIQSLLHKETRISVEMKKNNVLGALVWGDGNFDFRYAYVKEIPNQFKIFKGDTIVTSGAGSFPKGIPVGKVTNASVPTGDNFMSLEIALFNDFSTLQYVYVIKNNLAKEQFELENRKPNEQ